MNRSIATVLLMLLAACSTTSRLEEDTRYVKLATVVDKHEFTEQERKQARAERYNDSNVSVGLSVGVGTGGGFGGMMVGVGDDMMGRRRARYNEPPQIGRGANRYTVQLQDSDTRIEVMSYGQYKVGECVKVLANHPTEFPRFFALKPDEHCK